MTTKRERVENKNEEDAANAEEQGWSHPLIKLLEIDLIDVLKFVREKNVLPDLAGGDFNLYVKGHMMLNETERAATIILRELNWLETVGHIFHAAGSAALKKTYAIGFAATGSIPPSQYAAYCAMIINKNMWFRWTKWCCTPFDIAISLSKAVYGFIEISDAESEVAIGVRAESDCLMTMARATLVAAALMNEDSDIVMEKAKVLRATRQSPEQRMKTEAVVCFILGE